MSNTAAATAMMSFERPSGQQFSGWPSVTTLTTQSKRNFGHTHDNPPHAVYSLKRARYDQGPLFDGPRSDDDNDVCMNATPINATHSSAMITPTLQPIRLSVADVSSPATGGCWWKAKIGQRQGQQAAKTDRCCIVCRGSLEAAPTSPRPDSLSVGNRILDGYFSKSAAAKQRTAMMAVTDTKQGGASHSRLSSMKACSFCDKSVCQQCCHECGRCLQEFCSFCLTSDYANGLEYGCLDCVRAMDRMQVDE